MPNPDDIPIPAALALAEEPFSLDDLEAAFAYLAKHDPDCDDPVTLLQDLGEDARNIDLGPLDAAERPGAAAVARAAGWRLPAPNHPDALGLTEWAGRHYADATAAKARAQAQAKEWRRRIDEWEAAEVSRADHVLRFFGGALIDYMDRYRALDPKHNKTLTLPSVVVKSTAANVGGVVVVEDEEAVIKWAEESLAGEEYDATIKTTTKVLLTGLRKAATITEVPPGEDEPDDAPTLLAVLDAGGALVPGVAIEPESVNYAVKVL